MSAPPNVSPDVALKRAVLALAIAAGCGATGYLIARATPRHFGLDWGKDSSQDSQSPRQRRSPLAPEVDATSRDVVRGLASDLVELPLPRSERDGAVAWRGVAAEIEKAFARRAIEFDLEDEQAVLVARRLAGSGTAAGAPVDSWLESDFAALLDLRAFAEHAADRRAERDALTRLARAIDPEPVRDSIRAALLADDVLAIRVISADLAAKPLPSQSSTLLGAALLRGGDVDDALDVWRTAATEHPDDPVVHLLLGWRLLALEPARVEEACRHLEAARALLPDSRMVRARLEVLRG